MVISTSVYVEHPDLALVRTIRALPELDVGVVSDTGTDPRHDGHFFWVETSDFEAFERALDADHTVDSYSAVTETERRRTYRIEYSDDAKLVSPSVSAAGGLVLESRSHANGWVLELLLEDHETLESISDVATAENIRFDVLELHQTDDEGVAGREFGLTEPQIEALVNAYLQGYYDEPREASLEELSALLDISQTAVSGRLRRGSARLIEEVLVESNDRESEEFQCD